MPSHYKKKVVTTPNQAWADKSFVNKVFTTLRQGFPTVRKMSGKKK